MIKKSKFAFVLIKKSLLFSKNRQKGMALIMVLSTIVFIILIVQETVFDTQIEYRSAVSELNSLIAYHAAKSGMEVNILRVKAYTKIMNNYGKNVKPFQSAVDLIWRFPLQWPPPIPDSANSRQKEDLIKMKGDSFMNSGFITFIEPENSRIDINDLASPIPPLREWTALTLFRLIDFLHRKNKAQVEEIQEADILRIIDNIRDWVDPDSRIGTSTLSEPAGNANQSFTSLEELRQVEGVSDKLYAMLKPFITIYGEKGLNINTAPATLIKALHSSFPIELAEEIVTLRSTQSILFTEESFRQFLNEKGFYDLVQDLLPPKKGSQDANNTNNPKPISYIYFDAPHNFRMHSIGSHGKNQKTLTATYFDTPYCITRTKNIMAAAKEQQKKKITTQVYERRVRIQPPKKRTDEEQNPAPAKATYTPTIIYWKESL